MSDHSCIVCYQTDPLDDLIHLHETIDHHAHLCCIKALRNHDRCPLFQIPFSEELLLRTDEFGVIFAQKVINHIDLKWLKRMW